jgi:hypothetical protein
MIWLMAASAALGGASCAGSDERRSRERALAFLESSATFRFDGMAETVTLAETGALRPGVWRFVFRFRCRHAGYGDRTGQVLAQVITPHRAEITVRRDAVIEAVMDGRWDMIEQEMIDDGPAGRSAPSIEVVFLQGCAD